MFEGIHKYKRIFIILTGTSINTVIDSEVKKKLQKEFVICVNRSYLVYDTPNIIFFNDKWELYHVYKNFKKIKNTPEIYAHEKSFYKSTCKMYPKLVPEKWVNDHVEFWYKRDIITPNNLNISPIWLFSYLLKNKYQGKIYLIGADFTIPKDKSGKNKYHFKNYDYEWHMNHDYKEKKIMLYKTYFEHNCLNSLKIFNTNPDSILRKFPIIDLKRVLEIG